jgi:tRNA A-37 threonylcarbamoyl transferase component Bud32
MWLKWRCHVPSYPRSTSVIHPVGRGEPARYADILWHLYEAPPSATLDAVLRDPEGVLASRAQILKSTGACTVGRLGDLVIKRWQSRGLFDLVKNSLRGSRAKRAGLYAAALEAAGIRTAHVLAWGERQSWGLPGAGYLVMDHIPHQPGFTPSEETRRLITRSMGELIGLLHRHGFTHRDLKPTNIVCDEEGRAYLIDLDGVRARRRISDRRAVRDLAKLARRMVELSHLIPRHAALFLHVYSRTRGRRTRAWWWKHIVARMPA